MFKGPDDFDGYDYFYVRLYWTGFRFPGEHRRGVRVIERFVALLRRFETKLGSKAVFWVEERPTEFGDYWIAHVHSHSPLAVPFCRY